jgi:hypothetical protein
VSLETDNHFKMEMEIDEDAPKMVLRRRASNTSQYSASSKKGKKEEAGAKISESQESFQSHFSRSGISDTFFDALNFSENEEEETVAASGPPVPKKLVALPENSEVAKSIGVVCTMSRRSTNKRQKDIKPFALQKTFYACPKIVSEEQKEKLKARIEKDIADFKFQKYTVTIHRFGLPFAVEEICCISEGYNLAPKILKAVLPDTPVEKKDKKRKRGRKVQSKESEDEDSEMFDVEQAYDECYVQDQMLKYQCLASTSASTTTASTSGTASSSTRARRSRKN